MIVSVVSGLIVVVLKWGLLCVVSVGAFLRVSRPCVMRHWMLNDSCLDDWLLIDSLVVGSWLSVHCSDWLLIDCGSNWLLINCSSDRLLVHSSSHGLLVDSSHWLLVHSCNWLLVDWSSDRLLIDCCSSDWLCVDVSTVMASVGNLLFRVMMRRDSVIDDMRVFPHKR